MDGELGLMSVSALWNNLGLKVKIRINIFLLDQKYTKLYNFVLGRGWNDDVGEDDWVGADSHRLLKYTLNFFAFQRQNGSTLTIIISLFLWLLSPSFPPKVKPYSQRVWRYATHHCVSTLCASTPSIFEY